MTYNHKYEGANWDSVFYNSDPAVRVGVAAFLIIDAEIPQEVLNSSRDFASTVINEKLIEEELGKIPERKIIYSFLESDFVKSAVRKARSNTKYDALVSAKLLVKWMLDNAEIPSELLSVLDKRCPLMYEYILGEKHQPQDNSNSNNNSSLNKWITRPFLRPWELIALINNPSLGPSYRIFDIDPIEETMTFKDATLQYLHETILQCMENPAEGIVKGNTPSYVSKRDESFPCNKYGFIQLKSCISWFVKNESKLQIKVPAELKSILDPYYPDLSDLPELLQYLCREYRKAKINFPNSSISKEVKLQIVKNNPHRKWDKTASSFRTLLDTDGEYEENIKTTH
jgi:hypothetical protein